MASVPLGPFRIFRDALDSPEAAESDDAVALESLDPQKLVSQELLRPLCVKPASRELEPYSRAWFEELETKRYAPHGGWIRRTLEFTRHANETLLMFGPGAGTDALQYQRHGTAVTICATPADHPALIRRNFELRGLTNRVSHTTTDLTLPFSRGQFDLAYLNLLYTPPTDLPKLVAELYRVLKPGGKVFVLAPARFDVTFWQSIMLPLRHWYCQPSDLTFAKRYSAHGLKKLFPRFSEHRSAKRHIRSAELPYVWRFPPVGLTQRLIGRVMVLRAFKPVSAALERLPVDEAA